MKTLHNMDLSKEMTWRQDLLPEELGCKIEDIRRRGPKKEHSGIAGLGRYVIMLEHGHEYATHVPRYSRPNGYPDLLMEDWVDYN